MILPYTYRRFEIEGFYEPDDRLKTMHYSASATHPKLEGVYSVGNFESWEQTKQAIETAIDEMISSWN